MIGRRYRLEEEIDSGGNGAVWLATDTELDREVAVKRALVRGDSQIRRLRREARLLAKVNHPHVVTVHDVVEEDDECWLVMEYVEGPDLGKHDALPPERVAHFGAQLADALETVHSRGIVHRDIKPGNVLVAGGDHAKLGDFGISRNLRDEPTLTATGLIAGTPGYLAPEVANGAPPTPASDVFSLGATLFRAIEGVPPVGSADNPMALVRRAAEGEILEPSRAGALAPILCELLRVDPAGRPTAAEAKRMLENVTGAGHIEPIGQGISRTAKTESLTVPLVGTVTRLIRPPTGQRHRVAAFAAVSVVVAVLLSVWGATKFPEPLPKNSTLKNSASKNSAPSASTHLPGVGEARTADPCGLTDAASLRRFGAAHEDPDVGNFNRCDVLVKAPGRPQVDVVVEFRVDQESAGENASAGPLSIERKTPSDTECTREVWLGGPVTARIRAKTDIKTTTDLCAIANVAAASARDKIRDGGIPRRPAPFKTSSLANVDACELLDDDALSRLPHTDAAHPQSGFGNWECRWNDTAGRQSVFIRFDQGKPRAGTKGSFTKIGRHDALIEANGNGEGTCHVTVTHEGYIGTDRNPALEMLLVTVHGYGTQPASQLCGMAEDVAASAAAKLPSR
ncbi:hypothetical protein GCM10023080_015950 [Streptomyces pseudoechinosporeus]